MDTKFYKLVEVDPSEIKANQAFVMATKRGKNEPLYDGGKQIIPNWTSRTSLGSVSVFRFECLINPPPKVTPPKSALHALVQIMQHLGIEPSDLKNNP